MSAIPLGNLIQGREGSRGQVGSKSAAGVHVRRERSAEHGILLQRKHECDKVLLCSEPARRCHRDPQHEQCSCSTVQL